MLLELQMVCRLLLEEFEARRQEMQKDEIDPAAQLRLLSLRSRLTDQFGDFSSCDRDEYTHECLTFVRECTADIISMHEGGELARPSVRELVIDSAAEPASAARVTRGLTAAVAVLDKYITTSSYAMLGRVLLSNRKNGQQLLRTAGPRGCPLLIGTTMVTARLIFSKLPLLPLVRMNPALRGIDPSDARTRAAMEFRLWIQDRPWLVPATQKLPMGQ